MNANELADELDACANATMETLFKNKTEAGSLLWNIKVTDVGQRKQAATMLRQQQAEIEALKKACLDEITKRVYADQTTKVMEGYWEEAQEEIERLKVQYGICEDKP